MNKVTIQRQAKRYYERYGNRATFFRVLRYLWHRPHLTLAIPALITLGFFSGQAGVIALILIFFMLGPANFWRLITGRKFETDNRERRKTLSYRDYGPSNREADLDPTFKMFSHNIHHKDD